ncbi:MAG TPA: hypothetical protein VFS71_05680 [Flavobacterium sp.]|uniref:hypothetical protein n=1 Tax=Flavobacterium sp. TaxID=239 RepID=UPI002DBC7D93|nr:hypothetical protein [Flavobacterium sp.]HEU4789155.1 hypothetical protein [Flavobacterium sp.]
MQFRKSKIKLVVLLTIITSTGLKIHSQTNSEISLYTKFDSIVGKENLGLNNGPLTLYPYKTIGDNNMFFKNDKYTVGNLVYDGQPYFNAKLKYDIYKDQLILNPPEQPEHIGISLIQDKIDSFSLYGKNFIKITKSQTALPDFTSGYYEIIKIGKNFNLFIKHHKDILKEINEEGVFYSFHENYQYYIEYNGKFYEANNKSNIVKVFPDYKKQINVFYQKNKSLSKTDYNQFINGLMISIYDSSINNSK